MQRVTAGRPLLFESAEEMQSKIDEYFAYCDNRIQHIYSAKSEGVIELLNPAPYTTHGLARTLGCHRSTLNNYEKNDKFFDTIKAAREKIAEDVETRLMEKNATGAIFNLKNNFGWKDEQTQNVNIKDSADILKQARTRAGSST